MYFFVDDIVLVNETRHRVNVKLEFWLDALNLKAFYQVGLKHSI